MLLTASCPIPPKLVLGPAAAGRLSQTADTYLRVHDYYYYLIFFSYEYSAYRDCPGGHGHARHGHNRKWQKETGIPLD
jgi:hypothetical protein